MELFQIVKRLFIFSENNKNICAAGDDDQSLYRFRGATVRNILEFPDKFNKNECKIIKLILNYRSEAGIIKFFSEWINETEGFFKWENFRFPKKLEAYRTSEKNYPSPKIAAEDFFCYYDEKFIRRKIYVERRHDNGRKKTL